MYVESSQERIKKKNSLEMKEMNLWRREMAYLEALFEELFSTFHWMFSTFLLKVWC